MDKHLIDPHAADAARERLTGEVEGVLAVFLEEFLEDIIDDAVEAMSAPVLVAAGGRARDPFAFTNVMSRWRTGIAKMAGSIEHVRIRPYRIREILESSDLPASVYEDVVTTLREAAEEGASDLAVRRRLSTQLIPKESSGKWDTRAKYRSAITRIARTTATENFNENQLADFKKSGAKTKTWVSMEDDRVRMAHALVDNDTVPIDEHFVVEGFPMKYPGDPLAPIDLTANCRCSMIMGEAVTDPVDYDDDEDLFEPEPGDDDIDDEDTPVLASGARGDSAMNRRAWAGVIGMENTMTGDGRLIKPEALRWADLPIPLRHAAEDVGGHDGARVVGAIETISRGDGGRIEATGFFDLSSDEGAEASRQVQEQLTTGVSMDLDDMSFEVHVAEEVLENMEASMDGDEGGSDKARKVEDGRVVMVEMSSDDEVFVTTSARIRAATIVAIPAFAEAKIALAEKSADDAVQDEAEEIVEAEENELSARGGLTLVAAGGPAKPPRDWFRDPGLQEPTGLTVTEDGRIYGHLATWGTSHIAFEDFQTNPPQSPTGYAYFHTGAVLTDDGEISTGRITLNAAHASDKASASATLAHYENTGLVAADIRAGEDAYGIWVAGACRPHLSEKDVRALRGAPLSGDWRRIQGNLELVAALAVNVAGFPIPRPQGMVASGNMHSLVASGMLAPRKVPRPGTPGALSAEDLYYLKALARREKQYRADSLAASIREERKTKVEAMASLIKEDA